MTLPFMLPICDMKDFNYELLLKDEFVLLVSKDNPLSKYNEIELSMIKDEPFVGLYDTIPVRVVTDTICKAAGFTPNYGFLKLMKTLQLPTRFLKTQVFQSCHINIT